ncbi:MAG: FliG C-terminal domain-containing protein [Elusimicrobiota bacterium]|nr:FliG C-terminal domain-containing protein [Elusimicrobiota bacterium]
MNKIVYAPLIILTTFCSGLFAQTMEVSLLEKQDRFRGEIEKKIKGEILDPILGKDKSYVFADIEFEIVTKKSDQSKKGSGAIQQYKERGDQKKSPTDNFILPGVPKPKSISGGEKERPSTSQGVQTEQSKGTASVRYGIDTEINKFQITVIHDDSLAQNILMLARERIDDFLVPYKIGKKTVPVVIFKPTKFKSYNIKSDLQRPKVYLPLIFAALFLLLLLFLFGPLWGFFRKYVNAMVAKPGAEVNIESKTEEGEGGGKGGGGGDDDGVKEGHQQVDMMFENKEPEVEDEDELMKNFHPFEYINEDNLKRLIYLFLLRKEEPWVIAVVLSYMKPDISRQTLSMLPVEVQAKVALEAITVRQATYEQIKAIDKDIKESIEFVVGGIEKVSKMLEDADPVTQKNILEYLKTQKPEIYERVRKMILLFEDIVNFEDKDIQTIIRSVNNEDIASAIHNAEPQIVDKFFKNMSQGAVNSIKEIMEYAGEVNETQVGDAQMKILDSIKSLEAEGKIAKLNEDSNELYILEGADMSMGSDRKERYQNASEKKEDKKPEDETGGNAEAASYLQAGKDSQEQGRHEEALSYLEYAVGLDANLGEAYQYMGSAYYALGRIGEAIAAYDRYAALSNDPAVEEWLNNFKEQVRGT